MPTQVKKARVALLQGTLDLLIPPILLFGLNEETGRWRTISKAMARILDLKGLENQEG